MSLTPYYEEAGGAVYLGKVEEILPQISLPKRYLAIGDPPYGVNENTARKSAGRGADNSYWKGNHARDFPPCLGDDQPYDPSPVLHLQRLVLWGGNHYASRLPDSSSWFIWDKRDGAPSDDNADCEMAWSNVGGPARVLSHKWRGLIKASEQREPKLGPFQKPVALGEWLIAGGRRPLTQPEELVLVLYAGTGSDAVAAKRLGRPWIAIEAVEAYCKTIVERVKRTARIPDQLAFVGAR